MTTFLKHLLGGLLLISLSALLWTGRASSTTLDSNYRAFLPLTSKPWQSELHTGIATFYAATGAGNCSFPATPHDLMVTAINTTEYADAAMCGAFVEVTGPRGVVKVRIVDRCPECGVGHLDLSREAFAIIADPVAGRVPIQWRLVSPELSGPIVYHFKEGSNPWWTAIQIRNHRTPIAKVEYRNAQGNFVALPRFYYNYFVAESGLGPGPYTLRVTDSFGRSVIDQGIPLLNNAEVQGAAQLPPP